MSLQSTSMTEEQVAAKSEGPLGQVILFGDSITENSFDSEAGFSYGAALSHAYKRRLDVVNRGFSGYNSPQALRILPKFMPTPAQANVELFVICFGANDSCLPGDPTGHHVPIDVYRDNLTSMINNSKVQAHSPRILLVTPPPVDEHMRILADREKGFTELRRTTENTKMYADACKQVGHECSIPVVDLWTALLKHAGWIEGEPVLGNRALPVNPKFQRLFTDGLHPTPTGYRVLYEAVMHGIKSSYPSLDPEKLPSVLPPWETAPK